ncbi:MAG: alanine:cation symporter family protein [Planctomycetes bacterium]|nr:alanine:cation symporter family protein [Planctomycetota bacterium]
MRQLILSLSLVLAFVTPALQAQDGADPGAAATAESKEPGWLEKDGSIDKTFGVLLEYGAAVPFFNLAELTGGAGAPPKPWTDASGATLSDEAIEDVHTNYGKILSGAAENAHPFPWKDKNGDEIALSPRGEPVVLNLPFVVVWLVIGAVVFTLLMRFVNVRMFGHAIQVVRGKYDDPHDHGEVSHFQALSSALSATVGLGNIAGVAIAVSLGGPGATIWMIVAGLLGMSLKFTECTLGQRYREIDPEGRVLGGPMRYLAKGLKEKGYGPLGAGLAFLFAIFCIGGSLAGGNSFQVAQALTILKADYPFFEQNSWVFGLIMSILVAIVILGGIKRIASTASKIVPLMCAIYVSGCILVLLADMHQIPAAFATMFSSAFSGDAVYGGAIGALITGFQRAAFSNEAGVGSASIAHSAAKTEYPVREGIVALLEPFIDTVVVCTMTALVIVITGVYNAPEAAEMVAGKEGAALTAYAFSTVEFMRGWFPSVLLLAVVLFAFSTMISWSYYGERCWTRLFGQATSIIYKVIFVVFVFLGSIISASNVLDFGDLMILAMAFPNIIGLYFLGGDVKQELEEYQTKLDAGEFKTFS